MNTWRVIFNEPQTGAMNMAIDQAIMESVSQGESIPTLRFYAWEPACLSLGYGQRVEDTDLHQISDRGWHIVRRATGGKAILHTDELTYSVTMPDDNPIVRGGIVESYRRLSQALLLGLTHFQVQADITSQDEAGKAVGAVCFEVPSNYEVTAFGKKLIGSAQMRRKKTVLQHGTIPLFGDVARICDALYFDSEQARESAKIRVRERATTIEEALGQRIEWLELAEAMQSAFAETFDLIMVQETLSESEYDRAIELVNTVYTSETWNAKR